VSPISKIKKRRIAFRRAAMEALQTLAGGQVDAYMTYRRLYSLWCGNNAALQELKPLFRIPGIDPDGQIAVNSEFREQVSSVAKNILPRILASWETE
jgi:hypothetical protein